MAVLPHQIVDAIREEKGCLLWNTVRIEHLAAAKLWVFHQTLPRCQSTFDLSHSIPDLSPSIKRLDPGREGELLAGGKAQIGRRVLCLTAHHCIRRGIEQKLMPFSIGQIRDARSVYA